mmetsp:Transcript_43433/g.103258  ORF Transcript_43433/g.103258 Transcript_43433/m.103258 type:complete len:210 (-) Transcript_43433:1158-1787(-)
MKPSSPPVARNFPFAEYLSSCSAFLRSLRSMRGRRVRNRRMTSLPVSRPTAICSPSREIPTEHTAASRVRITSSFRESMSHNRTVKSAPPVAKMRFEGWQLTAFTFPKRCPWSSTVGVPASMSISKSSSSMVPTKIVRTSQHTDRIFARSRPTDCVRISKSTSGFSAKDHTHTLPSFPPEQSPSRQTQSEKTGPSCACTSESTSPFFHR